jgi:hypothetical protein
MRRKRCNVKKYYMTGQCTMVKMKCTLRSFMVNVSLRDEQILNVDYALDKILYEKSQSDT